MLLTLFLHQFKSFRRRAGGGSSILIQILPAITILYIIASVIGLGIVLNSILTFRFPGKDPIVILCGFLIYYFYIEMLVRFLTQGLPTLAIQPYLIQNIPGKTLILFLNIKSALSIYNFVPIALFAPFTLTIISNRYGAGKAILFIFDLLVFSLTNNFFVLFVKRKSISNNWWSIVIFGLILILISLDYFGGFSFGLISSSFFENLLFHPWLSFVPVSLAIISYCNNLFFLNKSLYFDEQHNLYKKKSYLKIQGLLGKGILAELIILELKMLYRNKRPRSILLFSAIFMLFGFFLFRPELLDKAQLGLVVFGAVFITGLFIVNYGQYLWAWQSCHFDFILAANFNLNDYIRTKFIAMNILGSFGLLLSLFYGFMNWKIIPILCAAYLFNIGIHSVLIGFLATHKYKGIELNENNFTSHQEISPAQWLYTFLVTFIAAIIYWPLASLFNAWAGIFALGISGIISIFMQKWWISVIEIQFIKNKEKLQSGFRNL